jgi:molybdate transport system regulatory protein
MGDGVRGERFVAEKAKTRKARGKIAIETARPDPGRAAQQTQGSPRSHETGITGIIAPSESVSPLAVDIPEACLIVRIDLGPHGRLGPGKVLLLQRIEQSGSISAAARSMNMSYRQAWDLVDQLNSAFDEPVVASQTGGKAGGGAVLTAFGRDLVETVRSITALAEAAAAVKVEALRAKLRPTTAADGILGVE